MYLLCTSFGFIYVLAGLHLITLNYHVQILETGPWYHCCSWSDCAAKAWISGCLSGPSFFQHPYDRLARFSSCYSWVLSRISYCTLLLRLLVILYSWFIVSCSMITVYLCYYYWNVYYHCVFVLWFFPVLMLSVYTWGYFHPAYIRYSNVSVPTGIGRYRMVSKLRLSHLQYN